MKWNRLQRANSSKSRSKLRAAIIEPLEDRQLMSLTIDVRTATGGKTATVGAVGDVVNLQIWAVVSGSTAGTNDGFQEATGSLIATGTNSGSVLGNMASFVRGPYTASGAQNGTPTDLNGDGGLDVGSNDNAYIAGFFYPRAGGIEQNGTVSGDTQSFEVGTLNYTVTKLNSGAATDVNFRPRIITGSSFEAIWEQDGDYVTDESASLLEGTPVVITSSSAPMGSIAGTVSQSVNGTVTPLSGATVYLDNDNSGTLNTGDTSVTTASNGTYDITGLAAGTYHLREVVPSGDTQTSPSSSPTNITLTAGQNVTGQNFTDTVIPTNTGTLLTGTVIGTAGSYSNDGDTIAMAVDGNLNTFFNAPAASGDWVGLALGASDTITSISFAPRSTLASRMVGGTFQGSNVSNFASGDVTLYTVPSAPANGVLTTVNVSSTSTFQYVRYVGPSGAYCNVAEINFYGSVPTSTPHLTGTVIGTAGSYSNSGNTIAKAFDGNLSTYFDGPTANGNWAGLDLGTTYKITSISYAPRANLPARMVGGIFQGSNTSTFASGVVNLFTITATPPAGVLSTVTVSSSTAFRYVRYLSPNGSYGDVAEINFFGTAASGVTQLTGSVIGTSGSYKNDGNTIAKAFDGSLSTYFDDATANGNWAGLDLGTAHSIAQISYAPRPGLESRMVGGIFQASNTADFSSGVVNLYTVTATPTANVLTTVTVNVTGTYRYVRYLSPNGSYGDVAEVVFYG